MSEAVVPAGVATVVVQPSGLSIAVEPGETIFAAAARHGLTWPTVCGGQGTCRTCVLRVVEGAANLSPVSAYEQEGLDDLKGTLPPPHDAHRLACQVQATGDAVVYKLAVRRRSGPT